MAISHDRSSPIRRAVLLFVVASVAAFGGLLGSARPVAACSCAMPGSMKALAIAENAIFTGVAGKQEARGVPVKVDRWFWGQGAAPVVWLSASSFGDSASCGTTPPAPDSRWLWVAWRPENGGDFGAGLCSPSGNLDTAEGRAMLEEAQAVFEGVLPPIATETSLPEVVDPPVTVEPAAPAATQDPAAIARDRATVTILGALLIGTIALFGGVILVARLSARRTNDERGD
jgi:hypothetical protein